VSLFRGEIKMSWENVLKRGKGYGRKMRQQKKEESFQQRRNQSKEIQELEKKIEEAKTDILHLSMREDPHRYIEQVREFQKAIDAWKTTIRDLEERLK
tara:strand:- start:283 stop:576 length:294 start_codon:yes stop_codon:yes gene_type:complete